jgi:hypothetical protein
VNAGAKDFMSDPEAGRPKKVAPRNDFKLTPLSKQPTGLNKTDPRFDYEWFHTDPTHPSYVGKRLVAHEIGDASVGYAVVEPWQVVHRDNDPGLALRNPKDDQGAPIDTVWRNGHHILCRTPKANAAKYAQVHDARVELNGRDLYAGQKQQFGVHGTKAVVVPSDEADVNEALKGV